jgi:ABC-type sugar transport system substrate-binding protein
MKNLTRRDLMSLAAAGAAAPLVSAFPARADNKPLRIGYMIFDTSIPFYSKLISTAKKTAEELGVSLDIESGRNDMSSEIAVIQQFVSQGVDAILVSPSNSVAIAPVVQQVNQANIPVLAVNLPVDTSTGAKVVTYVGVNDFAFGQKQGELLVKTVGENAKVGYIMGRLGVAAQLQREAGLKDTLSRYPGIKIVETQSSDWDNSKALAITQDYLSKYPQGTLQAIVGQGPEVVTGAAFARQTGRTDVKFIAGDFPADVKAAIADGTLVGTVDQDPAPQGEFGIRDAVAWLKGDKGSVPQPNHYLPLPIVTKDNVDKFPAAWGG